MSMSFGSESMNKVLKATNAMPSLPADPTKENYMPVASLIIEEEEKLENSQEVDGN